MKTFELTRGTLSTELESGWVLHAPGIVGQGKFNLTPTGKRRSENAASLGRLDEVLVSLDVTERAVAEFTIEPASPVVQARRRGEIGTTEVIEFDVPPPPEGYEQILLEANEDGTLNWHLRYETVEPGGRRGAVAHRRYSIPLRVSVSNQTAGERRGLFSAVMRRVLKVLIYPITDFVIGMIDKGIARAWESKSAPYCVRTFEPSNFKQEGAGTLTTADWARLAAGPALLFVHGTFSTAHGGFGRLAPETIATLSQRYGGRMFALNHWTLSHDPRENVKWFVDQIPDGLSLDIDIVCHSRGGLVSRVLACGVEELTGAPERVRVGRIVFVATPNDGTLLAHPDHIVKMLDRYTNVVQFLPDGPVEVVLEAVITAIKTLAHAGLKHLPGLAVQTPDSEFLRWLRTKPQGATRYYAIAADWEPKDDSPFIDLVKQKVADRMIDQAFNDAKNDLVVPTLGVASANGPGFPINASQAFTFASCAGAIHTNLFGFEETARHLLDWLDSRSPLPVA